MNPFELCPASVEINDFFNHSTTCSDFEEFDGEPHKFRLEFLPDLSDPLQEVRLLGLPHHSPNQCPQCQENLRRGIFTLMFILLFIVVGDLCDFREFWMKKWKECVLHAVECCCYVCWFVDLLIENSQNDLNFSWNLGITSSC